MWGNLWGPNHGLDDGILRVVTRLPFYRVINGAPRALAANSPKPANIRSVALRLVASHSSNLHVAQFVAAMYAERTVAIGNALTACRGDESKRLAASE
jgi:hypothetical protein